MASPENRRNARRGRPDHGLIVRPLAVRVQRVVVAVRDPLLRDLIAGDLVGGEARVPNCPPLYVLAGPPPSAPGDPLGRRGDRRGRAEPFAVIPSALSPGESRYQSSVWPSQWRAAHAVPPQRAHVSGVRRGEAPELHLTFGQATPLPGDVAIPRLRRVLCPVRGRDTPTPRTALPGGASQRSCVGVLAGPVDQISRRISARRAVNS
jgi:hypothetical protein